MKRFVLACAVCFLSACGTGKYSDTRINAPCYPTSIPMPALPGCETQTHRVGKWASYALTSITHYTDLDCFESEKGSGRQGFGYDPLFVTDSTSYDVLGKWSMGFNNSGPESFGGNEDFGIYVDRNVNKHTLNSGGTFSVSVVFRPGQFKREFASLLYDGPRTITFQFKGGAPIVADASVSSEFVNIYTGRLYFNDTKFNKLLMTYLFMEEQPSSLLKLTISHPDTDEEYTGEIDFRDARAVFWAGQKSLTSLLERGCAR